MYLAQNLSKKVLKKEHATSSGTGKNTASQTLAKLSIWRGRLGIADIRHTIKLYYKNAFEDY